MMKFFNKIHIHPLTYFIIMMALVTGLFKYLIIISSIIIFHELGHLFIAKIFKRKITSIMFFPFGGLLKIESYISENIFEDLLISIGGILFQIIYIFMVFIFYKISLIDKNIYNLIDEYNTMIIAFNLIPICPLDGYKIIKHLQELFIPFKKTFITSFIISTCVFVLIVFYRIDILRENIVVFMFLIYSIFEEYKNKSYVMNRFYIERMNNNFLFKNKVHIKRKENMYKNRLNIINGMNERQFLLTQYSSKMI